MNWHATEIAQVLDRVRVDPSHGLDKADAERRLAQFGRNELVEKTARSPFAILLAQFTEIMVLILIAAAIISAALGDIKDAIVIAIIVVLNAGLGFIQEYRAERAIAALKQMSTPKARVRRGGQLLELPIEELVQGDVVLLEAGNLVPADGRVLVSASLRVEEAALTGESQPVEKATGPVEADAPLGDRTGMVFRGTIVTYGHGEFVVTGTGMDSEVGKIAGMLQEVRPELTPLQKRLADMARIMALAAGVLVAIIFILGLARGEQPRVMFLTALSMLVAAVPESLPAVVTIALALGSQRMLKRKALVRRLQAVETLGSVDVICSDKTGTLTENRMTVTAADVAGSRIESVEDMEPSNELHEVRFRTGEPVQPEPEEALKLLLIAGALCNDASLEQSGPEAKLKSMGDPTESALVVAAARFGLPKPALESRMPRTGEIPFDSDRKRMTTLHEIRDASDLPKSLHRGEYAAFTKGALDEILKITESLYDGRDHLPMDDEWRKRIQSCHDDLAAKGMRVLGFSYRSVHGVPAESDLHHLEAKQVFLGMIGMIDPPRPEVGAAVETAKSAGIRPVMITGDHPLTALQIARDLGIAEGGRAFSGQELQRMSEHDLKAIAEETSVYARVSPEHKLRIVTALQDLGHVVAVTGDGVNDAPALKKGDIGVAMGITGTDVSKQAADMVLLDDNFSTIVAAVEEGRVIYDNIKKFIKYALTANTGEIWVMLLAPFLGMPLPLLPLQILWINLVTDGLPGLALSVEPAESAVMRRKPHRPTERIIDRPTGMHILFVGLLMGAVPLAVGYIYWRDNDPAWQTMCFMTLTLAQLAHVLAIRTGRASSFKGGAFLTNRPMLAAVAFTFLLQLAVLYMPFLQGVFSVQPLPAKDFAIALALATIIFWVVEAEKALNRRPEPEPR